ncbi:MAG: UDP-N-acetylglucosamine 2-epimerase [Deltaproteobacteria bacterium SG8_13]|nr:MAG: UDP-N-acetylglucosamine 2-epimerase [Deltaproteobacteria bacterium SG8_13]
MNKLKIHLIAAARPNFMKIAPLYHALKKESWADPIIVHTGQHYDLNMSDVFFSDLMLPEPHLHLGVGSGSHAEQTGRVMIAYEQALIEEIPDLVVVVGDVNSTMACSLAAVKLGFKTAHLEAGLRSFDRTMPEEINRLVTDSVADILWTPSRDGDDNLIREGASTGKIDRVGNIMIDSMELIRSKIEAEAVYKKYDLEPENYAVVTLHRPSNVDDPDKLKQLCRTLVRQSEKIPMVFPVHPRTRKNIDKADMNGDLSKALNLKLLEPISYRSFMNLVFNCRLAITDSGGIQEETTYLGIACITLRPNTERPITIEQGTNQLSRADELESKVNQALAGPVRKRCSIDLWDGRTAERVVRSIQKHLNILK